MEREGRTGVRAILDDTEDNTAFSEFDDFAAFGGDEGHGDCGHWLSHV